MKKIPLITLACCMTVVFCVSARADIKGDMDKGLSAGEVLGNALAGDSSAESIEAAVKAMIENGGDVEDVVKAALGSGLAPEAVIAGAVAGGGDITKIVRAALSSGLEPASVARMCKDAGAAPETVASAIAGATAGGEVYGYTGGSGEGAALGAIPPGGGGGGGSDVSPNR